ncbi:MAG: hypothetical protein O7D91_15155, partial [Planctomycetota bacterium]|nr:hypothetical protein [Planctomycetota bacterium]
VTKNVLTLHRAGNVENGPVKSFELGARVFAGSHRAREIAGVLRFGQVSRDIGVDSMRPIRPLLGGRPDSW